MSNSRLTKYAELLQIDVKKLNQLRDNSAIEDALQKQLNARTLDQLQQQALIKAAAELKSFVKRNVEREARVTEIIVLEKPEDKEKLLDFYNKYLEKLTKSGFHHNFKAEEGYFQGRPCITLHFKNKQDMDAFFKDLRSQGIHFSIVSPAERQEAQPYQSPSPFRRRP